MQFLLGTSKTATKIFPCLYVKINLALIQTVVFLLVLHKIDSEHMMELIDLHADYVIKIPISLCFHHTFHGKGFITMDSMTLSQNFKLQELNN